MRRLLIGIAIAIVAIVIALFILVSLVNINKFRPQIQAELESKLNRPVVLGQMHLHLFPLSIKVDGITIGEPQGFPANPPFVQAKEVSASASLGSIFGGQPEIRDLTLINPQVELIQNQQGVWNFSNIGGPPANQPAQPAAANSGTTNFTLNKLKIVDGQAAMTNQRTKSPRAVYNHIDVTLANFVPGKPFSIAADIHFPGQGQELLSFNGTGGPLATGPGQVTPVNGRLSLQQILLSSVNSVAPGTIPANTDASMSGNAVIATQNQTISCKGGLTLSDLSVGGSKLKNSIVTEYDASLDEASDQFAIRSGTITMGPTVVTLSGNVNEAATPAAVDVQMATKDASIADLLEVANAFGMAAMQNTIDGTLAAQGKVNFAMISGANLASTLNGTLNLDVTNGHFKNVNILGELSRVGKFLNAAPAQSARDTVLKHLSGTFDIQRGVANTNNLAATLDLGSLSAQGSLDLVNEGLDMHMTAVLSSGVSKTVGGAGIGGFLNTALANNKGELVLPVLVTGTMEHPVFAPDVQSLAKMKVGHLSSLLNSVTGQKSGTTKSTPSPLNSLFKAFGKKH